MKSNIIRQSNLKNLFDCPIKYRLSLTNKIEQSKPMTMGLIFENFVLGSKEDGSIDSELGRTTKQMRESIELYASKVKPIFKNGEAYKKISYKGEGYELTGEIDYFGEFEYQGEAYSGILDLKLTGSIHKLWGLGDENEEYQLKPWDGKTKKHEFLQSFMYPYIMMRNTGEIHNFYYLVVESGTIENMKNNDPLIKLYDCTPTPSDFLWLEERIGEALSISDVDYLPPNKRHCIECQFFKNRSCKVGVDEFSKVRKINLSELGE